MTSGRAAIVGAGASAVAAAHHLLRHGAGQIVLIERGSDRQAGRGTAYGTTRPEHLLNVTAPRMSLDPDDPDHFARWLVGRGGQAEDYAPRRLFGDYLVERLESLSDRLSIIEGEAVAVERTGQSERVRLADGHSVDADLVVLAPGNLRPATPPGLDPDRLGPHYIADPWQAGLADGLGPEQTVLLVGTGLTAVDAALTLDRLGFHGRIVGLSRRGLVPRVHRGRERAASPRDHWPISARALLRALRQRSEEIGWRAAVHEVRRAAQALWAEAEEAERRRFLRHLRPWWDVHRHRLAPAVGARIKALEEEGRLTFAAGRLFGAAPQDGRLRVGWRPRGQRKVETLIVDRLVNCTGPELDLARAGEPLFDFLLSAGRMRPDPLRLGAEVDSSLRLIDRDGRACDTLRALGPITRGRFWESNAVADIGEQASRLARSVSA